MGYGVEQHETFTEQLRSDLASLTDRDVEVVNLGTPGYTSEQARLLLELHMSTLEPDVIVFLSNYNDRRAVAPGAAPDSRAHFASPSEQVELFALFDWSALVMLMRHLIFAEDLSLASSGRYALEEISVDATARVSPERYEENVREIIELAAASGADVILVGLPDNPAMMGHISRARAALAEGRLWDAERELMRKGGPIYRLLQQKTLNDVLRAGGREDEIRTTVPAAQLFKSTAGHTPLYHHATYIDVLERVPADTGVGMVEVHAPEGLAPHEIYGDATHLNAVGHQLLATKLARKVMQLESTGLAASGAQDARTPGGPHQ